jgi:hypothetical protein
MDCECYNVNKTWYLREVSIFDMKRFELYMYQIYYPDDEVIYNKTIAYQINVIHGLPLIKRKITMDFFRYDEVLIHLRQLFLGNGNVLVGYKGGVVEYNVVNKMGVNSINIELLGCPKYEELLSRYNVEQKCCKYHKSNFFHCAGHEVELFARFINEIKEA